VNRFNNEVSKELTSINREALNGLTVAIKSLLPAVTDPVLQPVLIVNPLAIKPIGIGGLIGISKEPPGEISGIRVEATALITVKANNPNELNATLAEVIQAFTTADRTILIDKGILHLTLDRVSSKSIDDSTSSSNKILEQELIFKVLYEFIKKPQETVGIIRKVSINLEN
jgi:hypothetical protein